MPPKFRRKSNRNRGSGSRRKTSGGGGGGRGAYLARTSGGTRAGRTTGRGTATSFGPAGSGSAGSGRSETERLQSQLAGAQALQRRTMAQLGAGDINKQQSKDAMRRANQRIRQSAQGLASMAPGNTIQGNIRMSDGSRPMNAAGRAAFDQIMRGVTGGKGSNFYNMSKGFLRPGQNIGGINRPAGQGFSPYQGKDMRMGLNKFAPISQGISNMMEKGTLLPFGLKGIAAKRYEDSIKDTPRTLADLGMGATDVTTAAQSLRNLPEAANELRGNMEAATKEAEMRQLRGQRFDREGEVKALENRPQGIASVLKGIDTTRNIPDMEDALKAQDLAGRAVPPISQRQPGVGATPMTLADIANMERMNAIRNQIATNTGILANLPEGIDPTQVGSIQGSGQGLQSVFNMQDFVNKNPGSIFPTGYNLGMLNNDFDTGLQFYGGDTAFGNTPQARAALEALRSTNPNQSFVNMLGGVGIGGLR